jgi:hypothetical protein
MQKVKSGRGGAFLHHRYSSSDSSCPLRISRSNPPGANGLFPRLIAKNGWRNVMYSYTQCMNMQKAFNFLWFVGGILFSMRKTVANVR